MRLSEYVLVYDAVAAGLHGPAICALLKISRATFNRALADLRGVGCEFDYDPTTKVYRVISTGPFRRPPHLLTRLSVQPNPRCSGFPNRWQGLPKLPGANEGAGRTAPSVRRGVASVDGEPEGA